MSTSTRNEPTTAACLTPPAAGGIAVIQVIGRDAPAIVNPLLQTQRAIDVSKFDPGELRFCRIVDRGEVLDDALVAARPLPGGGFVVDINLHGGPRIVQRVLVALKAAGAGIIDAGRYAEMNWPVEGLLEQEAVGLLARAKTRAVAAWLVRAPGVLAAAAQQIEKQIAGGEHEAARAALADLIHRWIEARYLLCGVRVVLTGEPNSGKSTLANALAGAEHSIVSGVPGTTRDWVELPAAIEGMPVTLVDTAGIRHTHDPLERESIRRAQAQMATADVVVHVVDRSTPPGASEAGNEAMTLGTGAQGWHGQAQPWYSGAKLARGEDSEDPTGQGQAPPGTAPLAHATRRLLVWSKSDLPAHAAFGSTGSNADTAGLAVSALTGAGLGELRQQILERVGMDHWAARPARLYTQRQLEICREALAALAGQLDIDPSLALRALSEQINHFVEGDLSGMI